MECKAQDQGCYQNKKLFNATIDLITKGVLIRHMISLDFDLSEFINLNK